MMFLSTVDDTLVSSLPKSILDNAAELDKHPEYLKMGKDHTGLDKLIKNVWHSNCRTFLPNLVELINGLLINLVMNVFNMLEKIILSYFVCFLLIIYQCARLYFEYIKANPGLG